MEVKPQTRAQSNNELTKTPLSWSIELAWSWQIRLLCSLQIVYIKHKRSRFQTSNKCFPNQSLHLNKRSTTHWTPKECRIKLLNSDATLQCNRRWSIVSPTHQHMQHHLAIEYPLCIKLSQVRILHHVAIHTKKETRWGALTPQMLFHGNCTPYKFLAFELHEYMWLWSFHIQ